MIKRLFLLAILLLTLSLSSLVLAPKPATAATEAYCNPRGSSSIPFLPKWYKYLNTSFEDGTCSINFRFPDDITKVLLAVFEILLVIVGFISVLFVTYGGFQYLTSTGEPEKAKNARTTIINALVGLTIAMLATVIVNLVAGAAG